MNFGTIKHYLLFGGGPELIGLALHLKGLGRAVFVVTSRRHAESEVELPYGRLVFREALARDGIEHFVTADIERDVNIEAAITAETLGISLSAEWIFSAAFIERFGKRLVNLHDSRLPRMRGGGGYTWLILRNERHSGSCIHLVEPGIDTGRIVTSRDYLFPSECRIPADYQAVARRENAALLTSFVADIEAGRTFQPVVQQEHLSTYWPRLDTDRHGYIDWQWTAEELDRFICAFDEPYRGASTFLKGRRVRFKESTITAVDGAFHPFQSGLVYRKNADIVFIAARTGTLMVRRVLDEAGASVLAGVRPGDRFVTPAAELESAKAFRAVISARGMNG